MRAERGNIAGPHIATGLVAWVDRLREAIGGARDRVLEAC